MTSTTSKPPKNDKDHHGQFWTDQGHNEAHDKQHHIRMTIRAKSVDVSEIAVCWFRALKILRHPNLSRHAPAAMGPETHRWPNDDWQLSAPIIRCKSPCKKRCTVVPDACGLKSRQSALELLAMTKTAATIQIKLR